MALALALEGTSLAVSVDHGDGFVNARNDTFFDFANREQLHSPVGICALTRGPELNRPASQRVTRW